MMSMPTSVSEDFRVSLTLLAQDTGRTWLLSIEKKKGRGIGTVWAEIRPWILERRGLRQLFIEGGTW